MAISKFTRMIIGARKGDVDSIRELKGYIYERSGVANKRLRSLERTGMTEYAYGRAYAFLNSEYQSIKFPKATPHQDITTSSARGRKLDSEESDVRQTTSNTSEQRNQIRFSQAVAHRDVEDLIIQAQELHTFLSSPTSKVAGARAAQVRQLKGIETLRSLGYDIPTDKERLKRISSVLGNDGLRLHGQYKYQLMESIDNALESGASKEEVQKTIDRYASGEITYNGMLEDLTK